MPHSIYDISIFGLDLALQAGELIEREQRSAQYETKFKDHQELVTSVDIKVDEFIHNHIGKNFPDHRIMSEEAAPDLAAIKNTDEPLWVIDPIDGTVNFAHRHHQVAVSIAYVEQGEAQFGVVHCPFVNETFQAIRGKYSLMNHRPIKVSKQSSLKQSLIATGFPYNKTSIAKLAKRLQSVLTECGDIRRLGSAALDICWVAMGRLDGYYETLSPWDFAAARLIAMEAGATCGHLNPVPDGIPEELFGEDIIIAAPQIYEALHRLLIEADSHP